MAQNGDLTEDTLRFLEEANIVDRTKLEALSELYKEGKTEGAVELLTPSELRYLGDEVYRKYLGNRDFAKLGLEMAQNGDLTEDTLRFLKESTIIDKTKLEQLSELYKEGYPGKAAKLLTPSERSFLGAEFYRMYFGERENLSDFLSESPSLERLGQIRQGMEEEVWDEFQDEMDAVVGIYALDTVGLMELRDVTLDPYSSYTTAHQEAERHSIDFILHFVIIADEQGIPPVAHQLLILKAIRFLYEEGDPTVTITENIRKIDGPLMQKWLKELLDQGLLQEGEPMQGKERLPTQEIFERKVPANQIATYFSEEHGFQPVQTAGLDFAYGFVLIGMFGLIRNRESHEFSREELLRLLVTEEMVQALNENGLGPKAIEKIRLLFRAKLEGIGLTYEDIQGYNILPALAQKLLDRWLVHREGLGALGPNFSLFSAAA